MEWSPRALGNRSILASPIGSEMQGILNEKVKHRELFRLFAPVVCVDDANENFECDTPIPEPTDYRLMVYPIRQKKGLKFLQSLMWMEQEDCKRLENTKTFFIMI